MKMEEERDMSKEKYKNKISSLLCSMKESFGSEMINLLWPIINQSNGVEKDP